MNFGKSNLWKTDCIISRKGKYFAMTFSQQRGLISILTWFFILIKSKNQSKPKHFNFISIILNSRLCSCFLFDSTRKNLEKMLLQRNPNGTFFTGFLSSYWPEQFLNHTAFPITALLRCLAKCRKWEERWCTDRIQTVKRSEQGFGFRYIWRERRSQEAWCKGK